MTMADLMFVSALSKLVMQGLGIALGAVIFLAVALLVIQLLVAGGEPIRGVERYAPDEESH
jgi:hypothetical protein